MNIKYKSQPCPICEDGTFNSHEDGTYEFVHARKKHVVVGLFYAKCNICDTQGYLPFQRERNQEIVRAYQSKLPDYVSPSDILAVREKYELTQSQANELFGGGKNGFSKWERGEAVPAGPTARLIKLALNSIETMCQLSEMIGVKIELCERHREKTIQPAEYQVLRIDDKNFKWQEWILSEYTSLKDSTRILNKTFHSTSSNQNDYFDFSDINEDIKWKIQNQEKFMMQ